MRTIIRTSSQRHTQVRREVFHALTWQVRPGTWSPPTDMYETEMEYLVRLEVAGMQEEDFEVSVESNVLFVAGVRHDVPERRAYHQMEIRFGKFNVSIGLPGPVDVDAARAEYIQGFLTIFLPRPRTLHVSAD